MSEPIQRALTDNEARGQLLLTEDPTLFSLTYHQETDAHATAIGTAATWAVALVEPVTDMVMVHDGGFYALTLAVAAKLGFVPFRSHVAPPAPAANWGFRDGAHCELVDPTGTVIARFPHSANRRWRSAAAAHGYVLVLYGGRLGVRRPGGVSADEYNDRSRDEELHASLGAGTVVAGAVAYIGQ